MSKPKSLGKDIFSLSVCSPGMGSRRILQQPGPGYSHPYPRGHDQDRVPLPHPHPSPTHQPGSGQGTTPWPQPGLSHSRTRTLCPCPVPWPALEPSAPSQYQDRAPHPHSATDHPGRKCHGPGYGVGGMPLAFLRRKTFLFRFVFCFFTLWNSFYVN